MKYIYFYISALIIKIVNSLKPFIEKYIPSRTPNIIKTLSGLLQNIPYINPYTTPNDKPICDSIQICDVETETCKEILIPGFMEHDPKAEALSQFKRKNRKT
jgi:hypothetical protein